MKIRTTLLVVAALLGCHREKQIFDPQFEGTIVRSGASFGECLGYCTRELEITSAEMTFTRTGWNFEGVLPPSVQSRKTRWAEWTALTGLINTKTIDSMDSVYGCPDCVDQGAEWIELIQGEYSRKITFEFGHPLPQVQALLDKLREYRAEFEN